MTDATISALIAGIPATLAALGALYVSIRNSAKADVIVGHVNSAATKAAGEIAALRQEVEFMRTSAVEKRETALILAQSQARPIVLAPPASAPPSAVAAAEEPVKVKVVKTPLATVTEKPVPRAKE